MAKQTSTDADAAPEAVSPLGPEDTAYAHAVARKHAVGDAVAVVRKLNDEQLQALVAAGRAGDLATVKRLLGAA